MGLVVFYFRHHAGAVTHDSVCAGQSGLLEPGAAALTAIFRGNYLASPVSVLYRRDAFQIAGGHHPSLPLLADFDLYTRLAQQVPTLIVPRVLGHFLMHDHRYAKKGSGTRRESMNAEALLTTALLRYAAAWHGEPVPALPFARRMAALLSRWIQERLGRRAGHWKRALLPPRSEP